MDAITRAHDTTSLRLQTPNGPVTIYKQAFLAEHGIDGLIRIESDDFILLPLSGRYAHFNLERANHEVGKRYGLIRIIEHGSFDSAAGVEKLPLLSPSDLRFARCVEYQGNIPFASLANDHFIYALPSSNNPDAVWASILRRYRQSLPGVTDDEMRMRGVAYTLLEIEAAR